MNYDLKSLDKQHYGAYRKCTDLLQLFMDHQCQLRKHEKESKNHQYAIFFNTNSELKENQKIINLIQWVRYHLMGNDDYQIAQKTHITSWVFASDYNYYTLFDFAQNIFKIDAGYATSKGIVGLILEYISQKQSHSIFDDDLAEQSMTLQKELNRIRHGANC
jgi:hypothetical protein